MTSLPLGGVLYDISETLEVGSVGLYLDGDANLITAGDVKKSDITTTIDHEVSGLVVGTHISASHSA